MPTPVEIMDDLAVIFEKTNQELKAAISKLNEKYPKLNPHYMVKNTEPRGWVIGLAIDMNELEDSK